MGLALAAGACDSFAPREPPPPCDPATEPDCVLPPPFLDPTSPEIVRQNIEAALETFTVENYEMSLTDSLPAMNVVGFAYIPDALAEAAAAPGFFVGWGKTREVQFMQNLLRGSTRPRAVAMDFPRFVVDPTFPSTTNERRYEVHYELTLEFSQPELRIERYCGRALWTFVGGDRNFWTVSTWEDLEPLPDPSAPCQGTMGILRAVTG